MSNGTRMVLFVALVLGLVFLAKHGAHNEDHRHKACVDYGVRHHQTAVWTGDPPRCYVHGEVVST